MLFVVHHTDAEGADALSEVSGGNQLGRLSMVSRRDRSKNFELRIPRARVACAGGLYPRAIPSTTASAIHPCASLIVATNLLLGPLGKNCGDFLLSKVKGYSVQRTGRDETRGLVSRTSIGLGGSRCET